MMKLLKKLMKGLKMSKAKDHRMQADEILMKTAEKSVKIVSNSVLTEVCKIIEEEMNRRANRVFIRDRGTSGVEL